MFQAKLNERESPVEWPMLLALLALDDHWHGLHLQRDIQQRMFRQLAWYRQPAFKQISFYASDWLAQPPLFRQLSAAGAVVARDLLGDDPDCWWPS